MKRGMLLATVLVCFASAAGSCLAAPVTEQSGTVLYIWSADIRHCQMGKTASSEVPPRDLNGDGKAERMNILTLVGASSHGNTLRISSGNERPIVSLSFSSGGGCAIVPIAGKRRSQIVVWDCILAQDEAHTADHRQRVDIYDWDTKGRIVKTYTYMTRRKYPYDIHVKGPFMEFQQNRSRASRVLAGTGKSDQSGLEKFLGAVRTAVAHKDKTALKRLMSPAFKFTFAAPDPGDPRDIAFREWDHSGGWQILHETLEKGHRKVTKNGVEIFLNKDEPMGYRASFKKNANRWKFVWFVAGD